MWLLARPLSQSGTPSNRVFNWYILKCQNWSSSVQRRMSNVIRSCCHIVTLQRIGVSGSFAWLGGYSLNQLSRLKHKRVDHNLTPPYFKYAELFKNNIKRFTLCFFPWQRSFLQCPVKLKCLPLIFISQSWYVKSDCDFWHAALMKDTKLALSLSLLPSPPSFKSCHLLSSPPYTRLCGVTLSSLF